MKEIVKEGRTKWIEYRAWKNYVMKHHEEMRQKERFQKELNAAVSQELRQALDLAMKGIRDSFK